MTNEDYQTGKRDGKISALEANDKHQNDRLDEHSNRLRVVEKVIFMLIGAFALIEIIPSIKAFL